MSAIKKGSQVRLVQPEIAGQVLDRRINPETDEVEVLVEWADASGDTTQRWFEEGVLEAVEGEDAAEGDQPKAKARGKRALTVNPAEEQKP